MADNEEEVLFKLNIDDADFVAKVLSSKETLKSLGDSETTEGLLGALGKAKDLIGDLGSGEGFASLLGSLGAVAAAAGIAVVAAEAMKKAFELSLEGEEVDAVSKQFDVLATNAGLAGEKLKEGLMEASKGLISETEVLKIANESIIRMGASAQDLDKILGLAVDRSKIFGGTVEQNFQQMTQAISIGSSRMLKHMGIVVDINKAYKDFADANGIAANSLSQTAKQQALLDAILESSSQKTAGATESIKPLSDSWQRLKVSFTEAGEVIAQITNKVFGGFFQNVLQGATRYVNNFGDTLKSVFGVGTISIDHLNQSMDELIKRKEQAEKMHNIFPNLIEYPMQIKAISNDIDRLQAKIDAAKSKAASTDKASGGGGGMSDAEKQAEATRLANEQKFYKELSDLKAKAAAEDIKDAQSETQLEAAQAARKLAMEQQYHAEVDKINQRTDLNAQQKAILVAQAKQTSDKKMLTLEQEQFNERQRMWDNYAKHATSQINGVERGFIAAAKKEQAVLAQGNKQGETAYNDLKSTGLGAFKALGQGAVDGSDAVKQAFLSSLGEMAVHQGEFMVLDSFKTFPAVNYPELAAGGALIALGGALGAASSGSSSGGGGGAAATTDSSATTTSTSSATAAAASTTPKNSVNLIIQGHVFNTTQTQTEITNLVRNAQDATDFTVKQVGS